MWSVLLLLQLLRSCLCSTAPSDVWSLWRLYNSTGGAGWTDAWALGADWDFDGLADPCADAWKGVSCAGCEGGGAESCVVGLALSGFGLQGELPEEVCALEQLAQLALDHNMVNGTMPACVFDMPSLVVLTAAGNNFTGAIDISLNASIVAPLQLLDLSYSSFSGSLPSSMSLLASIKILRYIYFKIM
jgi:hypothetical protein